MVGDLHREVLALSAYIVLAMGFAICVSRNAWTETVTRLLGNLHPLHGHQHTQLERVG